MVTSRILKSRRVLGVAVFIVAVTGCRNFDEALELCLDAGTCFPDEDGDGQPDPVKGDGGKDDGGTPDSGTDGGQDDGGTPDSGTDGGQDGGQDDGGTPDSGTPDSGPVEPPDSGPVEPPDSGPVEPPDSGPVEPPDSGPVEPPDSGPVEPPDSGPVEPPDSGPVEPPDSGPVGPPDGSIVGADAGTVVDDAGVVGVEIFPPPECASGLCLRHEYALSGPYEFQGLWGSGPEDVFLAARARPGFEAPAQVVRFSEGRFSATTVDLPGFQPFRLQGTGSANLWAINEAPASGPCWLGDEHLAGPYSSPLLHCPSPLFRFDGQHWAPVGYVTNAWATIQPPALFTGLDSTWVASSGQGLLRWTGTLWQLEPANLGTVGPLTALWGDASRPRLGVGNGSLPLAAFPQPTSWGDWTGSPLLESGPFVAIAGPNEEHLYAATASEVLSWIPGGGWQSEFTVPRFNGQAPAIQDIWVSQDGSDVWVTLRTPYVLRKHAGKWSVVHLPVEPGFTALQVEGFDTPAGDLWITGTLSYGSFFGTIAYHYERQNL